MERIDFAGSEVNRKAVSVDGHSVFTREASPAASGKHEDQSQRKTHHRSSTAFRVADLLSDPRLNAAQDLQHEDKPVEMVTTGDQERQLPPMGISDETSDSIETGDSSSSSESGSTVTNSTSNGGSRPREASQTVDHVVPETDVLSFLDADSPQVTPEAIRASLQNAFTCHSEAFSDDLSSIYRDTHPNHPASLESNGVKGDDDVQQSPSSPHMRQILDNARPERPNISTSKVHRSYGTPEMPRGKAKLPHISPNALTPRAPAQPQVHVKHLPRAEKLPLTGYEQLASRLSSQGPGPALRPIYRRFGMLNHRLLLHLQDELCELEEQLHRLDTADTQNRRLQNGILPSSRRADSLSAGELQWHKTDVLGKIGFKLEQYNRVLESFQATKSLQSPTLADVHEYRGYLATHAPIIESETQFLDATDGLVCVGELDTDDDSDEDGADTPLPREDVSFPGIQATDQSPQHRVPSIRHDSAVTVLVTMLQVLLAFTLVYSIVTWGPGFGVIGRFLVASLCVLGVPLHSRSPALDTLKTKEIWSYAWAFAAIMAIIASTTRWQMQSGVDSPGAGQKKATSVTPLCIVVLVGGGLNIRGGSSASRD
ncbi:uncharacterized protein JN550_013358 [Neoarthrinium moseri]|uniref:uncharacterized protein n=1 Tax=Neoarthrinium moseri TaxID=1658444 RepID=UPI001FDC0173|nr:uncharacterized protein JN550_013358 [Neoarthrinium moseri]KAI1857275.1 hypothetical protein JN550_013358 [Neoarthrinium moseri]